MSCVCVGGDPPAYPLVQCVPWMLGLNPANGQARVTSETHDQQEQRMV